MNGCHCNGAYSGMQMKAYMPVFPWVWKVKHSPKSSKMSNLSLCPNGSLLDNSTHPSGGVFSTGLFRGISWQLQVSPAPTPWPCHFQLHQAPFLRLSADHRPHQTWAWQAAAQQSHQAAEEVHQHRQATNEECQGSTWWIRLMNVGDSSWHNLLYTAYLRARTHRLDRP